MIETIAEHQIDLNLLPDQAMILDLGCRNFLFAKELTRRGYIVYTVDPDSQVLGEHIVAYTIYPEMILRHSQAAIAGESGLCGVRRSNDPQATTIIKAQIPLAGYDIPMYTLKSFSKHMGVDFWDLIKIDVEGSEYEIIMSLEEPPARQISIEFHLHTGAYQEIDIIKMCNKLSSLGYVAASHEKTAQHGCGLNYWSSLFILKS